MNDSNNSSGNSCWLYGCLVAFILMMAVLIGGYMTFKWAKGKVDETIANNTSETAMVIPKVEVSEEDQKALDERVDTNTSMR